MKIRLAVVLVIAAGFAIVMGVGTAWAQDPYTPLQIGMVTGVSSASCSNPYGNYATGASCFSATVQNCANTTDLGFTFGEVLVSNNKGTVVLFNGSGGDQAPGGTDYANYYVQNGYQVVQVVWNSPWETSDVLINYSHTFQAYSIKDAGCRPATVLNYVYQNIFPQGKMTGAGMCAQGSSAGSAAIGYALAEYGAYSYLDNVELLSGPVLSDIEKGCVVPKTPSFTVCPASQTYCQTGTPPEGGWTDAPQYIPSYNTAVDNWSYILNACNNDTTTTASQNAAWKQMSIVDGQIDSIFSYPQTALAGWLCSNTSVNCGNAPCQNNSAAEGQYFYAQLSGSLAHDKVYRIDKCSGQEGVSDGFLPPPNQSTTGLVAIEGDMLANCQLHH
jgi:hypothetical protein